MTSANRRASYAIVFLAGLLLLGLLYYLFWLGRGGGILETGPKDVGSLRFLFAVYGPGVEPHPYFVRPVGVATDASGNIYVTDSGNNRVVVFTSSGNYVAQVGEFGTAAAPPGQLNTWRPERFNFPYGVAVDVKGDIYVADMENQRVQVYDRRLKFRRFFPDPARQEGPRYLWSVFPRALDVAGGRAFVADTWRIVTYGLDGAKLGQIGRRGPGGKRGYLSQPNGVAVAGDMVYVADSGNRRVQAFTRDGHLKWVAGGPKNPMFGLPRGLAFYQDRLIVADALNHSLQVLDAETGKKIEEVGERGSGPAQFDFPNDVAVTPGGVIYVADKENYRVQALWLLR